MGVVLALTTVVLSQVAGRWAERAHPPDRAVGNGPPMPGNDRPHASIALRQFMLRW